MIRAASDSREGLAADRRRALLAFGQAVASKDAIEIAQAATGLEKVVAADAGDIQSLFQLGVLRVLQGGYEDALRHFTRVAGALPRETVVRANLAAVAVVLERYEEAVAWCDESLALAPNSAKVLTIRGNALMALRRFEDAATSFKRALSLDPDYLEALVNCGAALRESRRFGEALEALDKAQSLGADSAQALCVRGAVLLDLERPDEALLSLDKAVALAPNDLAALGNRALALKTLNRPENALLACDAALSVDPAHPATWLTRGGALADLGRIDEALSSYDKGLALAPQDAAGLADKGLLLSEIGRFEEAAVLLREAVALAPKRAKLFYNLAQIENLALDDAAVVAAVAQTRDIPSLGAVDQVLLHYALAKVYEDNGQWEPGFRHAKAGAAVKRGLIVYDEAATLDEMAQTERLFDERLAPRLRGNGDESLEPIFIVGMPRSGSTLVEQILSSLAGVCGLGEIDAFGRAMGEGAAARPGQPGVPEFVKSLSRDDVRRIGEAYARNVRRSAPPSSRTVDKMLDNFRYLGLIVAALPRARIIAIRRDPIETCLSCFSRLFSAGVAYSYDLGELGRYYRAHEKLMDHWRATLPDASLLTVDYRSVVSDLAGESRRMAAFCGMDWDPRCLEFHKTARQVRTASRMQVRQPLFDGSHRRGDALAPHLQPLLTALRAGD